MTEIQDLGIVRPAIIPHTIVATTLKVMRKKVLKCLQESKFVDIDLLKPAALPQLIAEIVKLLDIGILIPDTLTQVIVKFMDVVQVLKAILNIIIAEDMMIEVDLGHKIPATFTIPIGGQ